MTNDVTEKDKAADTPEKKRFVTFGQTFQKWSTYLSIDWGLNYILGVTFAMVTEFSSIGRFLWTNWIKAGAGFISETVMKQHGAAKEQSVTNVLRFASIIAGGMFTIPPLMILESKKVRKSMIQWYDKKYYGKDRVNDDPRFAEAYATMDETHKQAFWTGLISRIGALAPLLASVWVSPLRRLTHSQDYLDWVGRGSATAYNAAGLNKERLFKGQSPDEQAHRWKVLHENSAMDFGLEPMYAVLHMIFYRGLAKIVGGWQKHQIKEGKPPSTAYDPSQDEKPIYVKKREAAEKEKEPEKPSTVISKPIHETQIAALPQAAQVGA